MDNPKKLFIVEGDSREVRIIKNMVKSFLGERFSAEVIVLPSSQNIYMLYQQLRKDDFETDIVELLRDTVEEEKTKLAGIDRQDIDEVFLFYDYDIHQDNLKKGITPEDALTAMLRAFDNETESGKLYISYPMVEALYDYMAGECEAFSNCFVDMDDIRDYKETSGKDNPNAARLNYQIWEEILAVFPLKIKCLFRINELNYNEYLARISSNTIYCEEKKIMDKSNKVFVLSAFPQFLYDYRGKRLWILNAKLKQLKFEHCAKYQVN